MKEPSYLHLCSDCAYFGLTLESGVCSSCIYTFDKRKWKGKNEPEHTCDNCRFWNYGLNDTPCYDCENNDSWEDGTDYNEYWRNRV